METIWTPSEDSTHLAAAPVPRPPQPMTPTRMVALWPHANANRGLLTMPAVTAAVVLIASRRVIRLVFIGASTVINSISIWCGLSLFIGARNPFVYRTLSSPSGSRIIRNPAKGASDSHQVLLGICGSVEFQARVCSARAPPHSPALPSIS